MNDSLHSRGRFHGTRKAPAASHTPANGDGKAAQGSPAGLIPLLCITGLAAIVILAWCAANAKWSAQDWAMPTTYAHDPERGDFFSNATQLKASSEWSGIPYLWKTVRDLGAPYDANWNDFPTVDELAFAIQVVLTRSFGLFAGINAFFALAHLLSAVAFYAAARLSGANVLWSIVGGLAFGLAPFLFAQSPHHMMVAYLWPVAFFPLVWRAVSTPSGLVWGTRPFWIAVAFGFVAGLHFVYYTNIFCQLVLLGAAVQYYRTRNAAALKAAMTVIAAAAVGFAVNNIDDWTYRLFHEPNSGAFVREYKWLEIYGLKIIDLFIPPVTHRSDTLAAFAKSHRQAAPLLDEGASYQGMIGLACLLWLVGTSLKAMIDRRERDVPIEAWWVLWVVLMFTTGGLNAIIGALGFTMFRGSCRYSVVILAIALLWATRRLSAMQAASEADHPNVSTNRLWTAAALAACLLILWDQVPRAPTAEETATIRRGVDADREFAEKMEASLPEAAMVFQLPVMDYPESPIAGVPSYDHFRPYLYSKKLRYSFGSQKGRDREKWQPALQGLMFEGATLNQQAQRIDFNATNFSRAVDELKKLGFSAIYINRNGFPDRAKGLEEALLELGYSKPPIRNATGDLVCIVLEKDIDNSVSR